jgi:hypothetical protein
MKRITLLLSLLLVLGCIKEPKKSIIEKDTKKKVNVVKARPKQKVVKNNYDDLIKRTKKFADNLNFDLDYIRKKGLADKKFLAEYLGMYLKLDKAFKDETISSEIRKKLDPFYQITLDPKFHNMTTVDDKLFKKNSMSYMRIMWLFNELGFDTTFYKKELLKVKKRMDTHLKKRGEWQRAVFDKYYDFFNLKKPTIIKYAKKLKGPITTRKPIEFYKRTNAYILTHFLFAAYDYGNKKTQDRFTKADIKYLKDILPQIIKKFELKQNDDIVAELLTCLILIGDTDTQSFKLSFARLLRRQNNDGSFGSYERSRKKIGSDVEFRQYMHTTLVALETFVEFEDRK